MFSLAHEALIRCQIVARLTVGKGLIDIEQRCKDANGFDDLRNKFLSALQVLLQLADSLEFRQTRKNLKSIWPKQTSRFGMPERVGFPASGPSALKSHGLSAAKR
jgi:hypothetical protein